MAILAFGLSNVLLLNATLTVEAGLAGSHQKQGWEEFTDAVIEAINNYTDQTVLYYGAAMQNIKVDLLIHQNTWC